MKNNLQASSFVKIYSKEFTSFLESEKIEFSKESFKNVSVGSWIEIESRELKARYISDKRVVADSILEANGNYFYADISFVKKGKEYKKSRDKSSFLIKIKVDRKIIKNSYIALSSLPVDVVIMRGSKVFAYANLYFNGSFLLELKEIL